MHCSCCYRCHAKTIVSTAAAKVMAGSQPVLVEEVPCCLCPSCGAVSFSGEVLMAITEVLSKNLVQETVQFPDIAGDVAKVKIGKIVLHQIPDQGTN